MTTNIDLLAKAIRRVDGDHTLGAGALAEALDDAGCRMLNLPEPIINADDGNPEWHADEYTVDVDQGRAWVNLWTPDGTHWKQTPNQARNLIIALLAAADYAEKENSLTRILEGKEA